MLMVWRCYKTLRTPTMRTDIKDCHTHMGDCLSLFSLVKLWQRATWRVKQIICLTYYNQFTTKDIRAGSYRYKLRQWTYCGIPVWLLLSACSIFFYISFQITCPRRAPTTVSCALPHESPIKTLPHRQVHRSIGWGHCLNWGIVFSGDHEICQVHKKLSNTLTLRNQDWTEARHWCKRKRQSKGSSWYCNSQCWLCTGRVTV